MMGTYLYGIMRGGRRVELGRIGLLDGWAPVSTVTAGGLAAVVSRYRGPDIRELPKTELLRCLSVHQRVVERAMGEGSVLPARFGTVLRSRDEAKALLNAWHQRLATALGEIGDAVQIEVAAIWDRRQVLAQVAQEAEIAALAQQAAGRPAEDTLAARIHIGKLVKAALDRRRAEYLRQVAAQLRPIAVDSLTNPLATDEMVLNVAFLVEQSRLDEFYAWVHWLDRSFESRLTFRCVGPLPPYSFSTVEIVRLQPDQVSAALRLLDLGERVSEAEVNSHYRRLAARWHPDHNPGDPEAARHFAVLADARARVVACLRSQRPGEETLALEGETQAEAATERHEYDLSPEAVRAALLLTIRRAEGEPILQLELSRERDAAAV